MNLELTPQQYRMLVTYLKVADWMINAEDRGEEALDEKDMLQHIYKQAAEFECPDLIERNEDTMMLDVNEEVEEAILETIIDKYNNTNFWETLIMRLAVRDMADYPELGKLDEEGSRGEEFFQKISMLEAEYQKEFEMHGLDRLTIFDDGEEGEPHVHGPNCSHNH